MNIQGEVCCQCEVQCTPTAEELFSWLFFCWISANPLGAILADIIDPSSIQTYKEHVNICDWVDLMLQEFIFIFRRC